jgi:hypothetical protein
MSYEDRENRHVQNLALLGPQDVYKNLAHLDLTFLEDLNIDAQCVRAELITGFLQGVLRARPQRTWSLNQEHYSSVITHQITYNVNQHHPSQPITRAIFCQDCNYHYWHVTPQQRDAQLAEQEDRITLAPSAFQSHQVKSL